MLVIELRKVEEEREEREREKREERKEKKRREKKRRKRVFFFFSCSFRFPQLSFKLLLKFQLLHQLSFFLCMRMLFSFSLWVALFSCLVPTLMLSRDCL